MGWSPTSLANVRNALREMEPDNIELLLAEDSSLGQREIIALGTLKDNELQTTIIEYLQNLDLGTRRSMQVIERARNKDYAWEDLASRSEDPKPDVPIGLDDRLFRRFERAFYTLRGLGVPSIYIMGKEKWRKAMKFARGIEDWSRFLQSLDPEVSDENQPAIPDMSYIKVDERKIIEAEFSVIDERENS